MCVWYLIKVSMFAYLHITESALGIQLREDDPEHIDFFSNCDQCVNHNPT